MTMSVKAETQKTSGGPQECAGCGKKIQDRYLLKALDTYWHEDCLKCGCCDCRLGEVGSTLYTKGNLILCRRDYLRYKSYVIQMIIYVNPIIRLSYSPYILRDCIIMCCFLGLRFALPHQ